MSEMRDPDDLITLAEVVRMVSLGKSTIYNRIADGTFPDRYDLGGGVIRWRYGEVDEWRKSRPRVRRTAA